MPQEKASGRPATRNAAPPRPDATTADFRKDVYALHFPPPQGSAQYDKDVGLAGYDRETGKAVPGTPVLKYPGDKEPRARPFAQQGRGGQ